MPVHIRPVQHLSLISRTVAHHPTKVFCMRHARHMRMQLRQEMYFLSIECNELDRKLSSCRCVCRVHVSGLLLWALCLFACIQGYWISPMGLPIDAWG